MHPATNDDPSSPRLTPGAESPAPPIPPASPPFASAEEAWFWTMAALAARRAAGRPPPPPRPAPGLTPEKVLKCLDTLYRQRRIELLHARILRRWGERGRPPRPGCRTERSDHRLWREAMGALAGPLFRAGLIRHPTLWVEPSLSATAEGGEMTSGLSLV